MNAISQKEAIRLHLESGEPITQLEAINRFGCLRLSARILNLKKQGLPVAKRTIKRGGKHFAEYFIDN